MSLDFKSFSRSQQHLLLGLGSVVVMVLVAVFVIRPMRGRESLIRLAVEQRVADNGRALDSVRKIAELEQKTALLSETLATETNRFVLRPFLGSYPVQREIYRLASDTAFKIAVVREVGKRPTPTESKSAPAKATAVPSAPAKDAAVPSAPEGQPVVKDKEIRKKVASSFARYFVEVSGEGSFADLFALIERLELDNPYCGVNALVIRGLPSMPERHRVTLSLEWPVLADPPPKAVAPAKLSR